MTEKYLPMKMARFTADRLFASAFGYRFVRGLFHFGVRLAPIRKALDLTPGDRVLDVGCGTGDYSGVVDDETCSYTGIDSCKPYIEEAIKNHSRSHRKFVVGDIRVPDYELGGFTKALMLGVMHHLTDEENLEVLRALNKIITDRLVIMDLSPGGWHVVNTMLCRLDRGRYPRRLADQCKLIERVMDISSVSEYFVRSGVQRYALIKASFQR